MAKWLNQVLILAVCALRTEKGRKLENSRIPCLRESKLENSDSCVNNCAGEQLCSRLRFHPGHMYLTTGGMVDVPCLL
jgi:hypothetical protein